MGPMEIYLLRHGIAEDAGPGMPDSARALTAEGRDKLRRVLKRARQANVAPSLVLSSPYRRALETAGLAAETLGYEGRVVQTEALVPDASPHALWEELRARRGEAAILLASHEPLMSSAAAFLLGCPTLQVEMKKAALLRLDCERFGGEPRCILKWMLTPALAS
jgi:phosphohistidine phosphatase